MPEDDEADCDKAHTNAPDAPPASEVRNKRVVSGRLAPRIAGGTHSSPR